jgi:sulfide:quinone oxidoreductase
MRVLVLGAGFGGLELSSILSAELGDECDVVLFDKGKGFTFGFAKLDVMFCRTSLNEVTHRYDELVKPGVRFVEADVTSIDPTAKSVETSAGTFSGDIIVVALGADYDVAATPGLAEGGYEFYSTDGAQRVAEMLPSFEGGHVVIGVLGTPFKCPPAPSEAALLVHDYLVSRGLRDQSQITLLCPMPVPVPPSPPASAALLTAFAERGIAFVPNVLIETVDAEGRNLKTTGGESLSYDLFLAVPRHVAPAVVQASGLTDEGWINVDPGTLRTKFDEVFAVGDIANVGAPKAGVFAEGQARVVAAQVVAAAKGDPQPEPYDARGMCYLEFGRGNVARVNVHFRDGQSPVGDLQGPSAELTAEKVNFGSSRITRWFK